jgi:hypothetical protein
MQSFDLVLNSKARGSIIVGCRAGVTGVEIVLCSGEKSCGF